VELRPEALLLRREVVLVRRSHVLHETLLSQNLLLLQLPETPLFFNFNKLDLFLEFLLAEALFDLGTLSHLLHLLSLLLEGLPDKLRFQALLLILKTPSFLNNTVTVLFFSLPTIEL
jgi:hypothetical protein